MSATALRSWGNHPPIAQTPHACYWRDDVGAQLAAVRASHGTTLAYGNGRSYGDSCLAASDQVLYLRPLDRFIQADWAEGIIKAEAGVTLEDVLKLAIPHGWFLPVTPGTKFVTLGGAVANDVHGKNHHVRGTFGRHVRCFSLSRSDLGSMVCSPGENAALFAATIGGLGLTGVIEWVEIQLARIKSSRIDSIVQRFGSLSEFFAVSAELDAQHESCVSWIDCTAKGAQAGRGIYTAGNFARDGGLQVETSKKFTIPLTPPFSLVNRLSLGAFNELYWHKQPRGRVHARVGYEPFFYPLDGILKWNRIYGRKGFQQYQCLIPEDQARPALRALLAATADSGAGSFLAVLKRCGDMPSPGFMSFPQPGTTLALDFPQNAQLESRLFPRLDAIVREACGRLYPAKDAHMSGDDFRRSYPEWERLETLRDPVLLSRFWRRVTT